MPVPETVLLIRVNSGTELMHTHAAVDLIRRQFPHARLATLATPQTETLDLLRADPRIDEVILFPPEGEEPSAKSPRAFRRFMAAQRFAITVVCFGGTPGFDYRRHILSLLLCPGRRFFLDARNSLFSAASPRGLWTLIGPGASMVGRGLSLGALKSMLKRRKHPWPSLADQMAQGNIRKVLWIRLDHIGDLVMTLPAMHAFKERYPAVRMDALALHSAAPVLADLPDIDQVLVYDAPHLSRQRKKTGIYEYISLVRLLRRTRYDLIIETRGDDFSRWLAYLSGAPYRLGPACGYYELPEKQNAGFLMTHLIVFQQTPPQAISRSLLLLRAGGLDVPDVTFRMPVTEERRATVRYKLQKIGVLRPYAVIHARASEETRNWRPERFTAAADYLARVYGLDVLLTGALSDKAYNDAIRAGSNAPALIHNTAGLFPLEVLPALFQEARLMVSVDTGPLHVAALSGTPLVALFLPQWARLHAPYHQEDGVLVGGGGTLDAITVDDVVAAMERKLAATEQANAGGQG